MRPLQATFIGIGAQKSASTWLYGVLQQCPDVRVSDDKEVDFFSYYFDRGYEWYERSFVGAEDRAHRGEISPSYLIHPGAPFRAAQYNPDMQVFVTLRDPVDRAYSNHLHEARKGHISGANLSFETALENNPLYRDQGRYAHHLSGWFDHFPREQIHVMFQEDIHVDRAKAARQVTDALGLEPLADFLDLRANESVRYRNAAMGETLWKIGNFARRNGLGKVAELAKSLPGIRQMRQANREEMREVVAPMDPGTAESLTGFYQEDVAALEALLGRSVPWTRYT
ncbi:sulfotransferase domain-containing protein [uncultured Tateyamaria sp.]|uniref:sulfotransferase domain-containing protein n=1 Tax=Tateyamaria sp. 1078 TaxID=3417464 RepID=UPI00261A3F01|nr:sulfotransferase domain-containing protein [uncultured Tateyamaria sp.]